MSITGKYKVVKLKSSDFNQELLEWFYLSGEYVNEIYERGYDFSKFNMLEFADAHCIWLCLRGGEPVGFMMATYGRNFFDPSVTTLNQRLLYSVPNTRAALLLLKEYIDFGKHNVDHTHSTIGLLTNVKPSSLEKLGFRIVESLYRLEV